MGKARGLLVVLLSGCVTELDTAEFEQDATSYNGTSLNGTSLNGTSLNGTTLSSISVSGTTSSGKSITASSNSGPPLSGTASVGSTWAGIASNGATIRLRIDSATQGTGTNSELWFHGVSYQTSTTWTPLCGADLAVPVAGIWNQTTGAYSSSTSQFSFACRNRSIAKCVEMGYKTYRGYTNQMTSCVRMLRADYCGTGASFTADGTLLNLYDAVGVQADTQAWALEGEWGPSGARCVSNTVINTRFIQKGLAVPSCVNGLISTTCGTFRTGTYVISELPDITPGVAPI
jgi:hypothetical protein